MTVNQRSGESPFPFRALDDFRFSKENESYLEISNFDAEGRVVIDAVRWLWLGE